jgi:hypothetical protein
VVVLSVDDDAIADQASAVVPWTELPDARGPTAELHFPRDGETFVALTSRIGISFDEMIEFRSVFEGSFRVQTDHGIPVVGTFTAQENIVSFGPQGGWAADTTYVVEIPAGGIQDFSGNAVQTPLTFRFSTGGELSE